MSRQEFQTVDQLAEQVETILNSATAPWPAFSGGQQKAWAEFQGSLRQEFGLTLWDELFKLNSAEVDAINSAHHQSPTSSRQYTADDWNQMIAVVYRVLAYKETIATAIEGQRVYLDGVGQIFSSLAAQTVAYVGLKESTPPPASFPMGDLLDIFLSSFNLIAPPEGAVLRFLAGFIKAVIRFSQDLAKRGGPNAPSPEQVFNDFTLRALAVERQLTDQFAAGIASLTSVLNATVSDYGKLEAVALYLNQPDVVWPQQAPPVDAATEKTLEITLWKLFLPTRWAVVPVKLGNLGDFPYGYYPCGTSDEAAAHVVQERFSAWPQSQWALTGERVLIRVEKGGTRMYAYNVNARTLGDRVDGETVDPHMASGSATRLFDVLGVSRADVFGRANGWSAVKVAEGVTLVKTAFPGGFDPTPVFGAPAGGYYPSGPGLSDGDAE
ncbi:MAG TPA: hypothetical protein VD866_11330 [Urbifossiella sp.]|nr:hypothetical protein [Urbifossiella sp.]